MMNLIHFLGYGAGLCLLPLAVKQVKSERSIVLFLKRNHSIVGWLMFFLLVPHLLLSFPLWFEYPFGIAAFVVLLVLDSFIFVFRKTKRSILVHRAFSMVLVVCVILHIVWE